MAGRAWKFGDDVDTDAVIPGRYLVINDPRELAVHLFEGVRPKMASQVHQGDYVVGGENFGCGSSREQAPQALKSAGFYAIAAKSYARIFYRNAFNIGLLLVECDTDFIDDGDELELDIDKGKLKDVGKGLVLDTKPVPKLMKKLLEDGGVVGHFKKYGGFKLE